ncbi:MAG: YfhO family protein [Eubacterium sp.]|nr:YfhO family protein [Eubacterium sp.]
MDITSSKKELSANKILNGETVNYGICYGICTLLFIIFKQLFKVSFGLNAQISVFIAFAISAVFFYFLENKFVFTVKCKTKTPLRILLSAVRVGIDIGYYKLCDIVFTQIIGTKIALTYIICAIIFFVFNYYFDRLIIFDCRANAASNKHGHAYKTFFNNRFVLLAGVVALLGISFVYIVFEAFPFGDITVMRMDLYHQYGPLYCELYDRLTLHKSFVYSWVSGGGSSFLGNFFNYLSSPFSLIILLFDRGDMPYAITTMVLVKAVCASMAFTYYIKVSQKSHCLISAAFGVFYAFCSYFLAYYWNIMWIDGMILFPIIMLGIEKIILKGKPLMYIASLSLLLFSSYYMGYMTCLFAVVYFLAYFFIAFNKINVPAPETVIIDGKPKRSLIDTLRGNAFINRGVRFTFASLLSGMICAVSLIPVYFILQGSSATQDSFPGAGEPYFDLINLISSHLAGLTTTIRSSGDDVLPNIFSGMLPAILLPLYILNKKISLKEKVVNVLVLLFFVLSFNNNVANFIWHAFHFPNDLPYRFSFMYSFIILVIGYRTLKNFSGIAYRDIGIVGFAWVFIALFFQKFPTEKINDFTILITLGSVMVWSAVLMLIKTGRMQKTLIGITVLAVAFCEVIVADTASYIINWDRETYMANYENYRETIEYVEDNDKDFYRQELCHLDTRMDPCLYGYNGISTFSSMAYEKYSGLQYSMGMFGNRINSYTYNTQTPVYNMMHAIKYITRTENSLKPSNDFYSEYYSAKKSKTDVYKNDYFLPISFVTSNDIKDWYCEEGDPFEVQESFIDNAAGVGGVFKECEYVGFDTTAATCEDVSENGFYSFSRDSEGGSIDITIKAVNNSNLYVYITSPEIKNVNYFWDDEEETCDQYIDEPYIMDLGKHKKGDEIRIELSLGDMETDSSTFEIYAYNINKDVFTSAYDMLKTGAINVTSYNDTTIEGTVEAGYNGYLFSSIPYDESWSVYIDGEKVKTFEVGDSMLTTTIKKGKHTVKYKYSPKGLNYGLVITGATWLCILVYGAYIVLTKKGKKKNI